MVDIVEVWSDQPDRNSHQWLCGTGYAIGGQLVLTAAHVVRDFFNAYNEIWVRPPGGKMLRAELAWSRPVDEADVAVLEVIDSRWDRPNQEVQWGRLTTHRVKTPFVTTGFPDVQATPKMRDIEQADGYINPRTTSRSQTLTLKIEHEPIRRNQFKPAWAGMSGAAVFCNELLTAIVIKEPAAFEGKRLSAVPATALADPQLDQILLKHTGRPIQFKPVELAPLAERPPDVESPAGLLRADAATTPFRPRAELDELVSWARNATNWSARLLVGPGGQGKTRLAYQLAHILARENWATLSLGDHANPDDLDVLRQVILPTLVVVDYAEARASQLGELTRALKKAQPPTRLLLLARTGGNWQHDAASRSTHLNYLPGLEPKRLSPLERSPSGREHAWQESLEALAPALSQLAGYDDVPWVDAAIRLAPPDLAGDKFRTILAVQMDALAALLQSAEPLDAQSGASSADILLLHEAHYWTKTAQARGLTLKEGLWQRAVAVATVWGAKTAVEARQVLLATPGFTDLDDVVLAEIANWISSLYRDHEVGSYWNRIHPDRLAEQLAAVVLRDQDLTSFLAAASAVASPSQITSALMLLSQASVNHPHLSPEITALVIANPLAFGPAAMQIVPRSERPDPLLDALWALAQESGQETLVVLERHIPERSLLLTDVCLIIRTRIVDHLENNVDERSRDSRALLASKLALLAKQQNQAGRSEESTTNGQKAVKLSRRLSDEAQSDLALHLSVLAKQMTEDNHFQESLEAASEAVEIRKDLLNRIGPTAGARRALADSLTTLANSQADLHRFDISLAIDKENVGMRRQLAAASQTASESDMANLAKALNNLANSQHSMKLDAEALESSREAVEISMQLTDLDPDAHRPLLAAYLNTLVSCEIAVASWTDALETSKRSITEYRQIISPEGEGSLFGLRSQDLEVEDGSEGGSKPRSVSSGGSEQGLSIELPSGFAYKVQYAESLLNHAMAAVGVGYPQTPNTTSMAISAAHEAVGIFRAMSNDFEARLADALRKLAVCTAIGDPRRGVNHAQESVAIYRRLANDRSGTGQQGLARALNTLSNSLAGQGDLARSLAAVVEAVQMQATLADGGLPADEIFYATCLDNLSRRLADAGEIEDATDRVNLAIEIRRRGGRRRELAQSLTTLSRLMCAQNRIEDAFHAADEAVTICRAEAKRSDFHYFNVTAATDNYANLRAMMQHHEVDAGASGRPLVVELFGDLTAGSDWGAILPTGPDSEGLDQS